MSFALDPAAEAGDDAEAEAGGAQGELLKKAGASHETPFHGGIQRVQEEVRAYKSRLHIPYYHKNCHRNADGKPCDPPSQAALKRDQLAAACLPLAEGVILGLECAHRLAVAQRITERQEREAEQAQAKAQIMQLQQRCRDAEAQVRLLEGESESEAGSCLGTDVPEQSAPAATPYEAVQLERAEKWKRALYPV